MRLVLLAIGYVSLGVAALGVVLPLLPTTPFLLLAFWAFTRASPALAERLLRSRRLGPPLRAWQERGEISRAAKIRALLLLLASWVSLVFLLNNSLVLAGVTLCLLGSGVFIATRPGGPRPARDPREQP
ncbi:YbaN family protein [Teichococcus oryzae]|uniref:DUF454 domain-containing protein n=1 Tax=Teichococcus oryzae TaxID=1608942 RepID=A0A5B2THA9_9PROT|nr:YbaN family protein [Pseudoroseomonas oryzae]KAA2213569.1 DUF454 domain-containing protein [Pseudoroseomonas oryzae]